MILAPLSSALMPVPFAADLLAYEDEADRRTVTARRPGAAVTLSPAAPSFAGDRETGDRRRSGHDPDTQPQRRGRPRGLAGAAARDDPVLTDRAAAEHARPDGPRPGRAHGVRVDPQGDGAARDLGAADPLGPDARGSRRGRQRGRAGAAGGQGRGRRQDRRADQPRPRGGGQPRPSQRPGLGPGRRQRLDRRAARRGVRLPGTDGVHLVLPQLRADRAGHPRRVRPDGMIMATETPDAGPASAAAGTAAGTAVPAPARHLGLALVVISIAQLMLVLDELIVNTALPHIQRALGFSGAGLEWVVTGYAVTFGGLLMLGGRAGDILGRRRVLRAGIAIFTIASLLGGLATQSWMLITARVLQGTGAALAAPAALSLIAVTFPEGRHRTRALGVYAAMTGIGGGVGLVA